VQIRVRALTGLVPVCAFCKKIRKPSNDWRKLEQFLDEHSEAMVIHELCPECARRIPEEDFRKA